MAQCIVDQNHSFEYQVLEMTVQYCTIVLVHIQHGGHKLSRPTENVLMQFYMWSVKEDNFTQDDEEL